MFRIENHDTLSSNASHTFKAPMSTATQFHLPRIPQQTGEYQRPCSPGSLDSSEIEKPSLDFTQWIERKLAEYNASDNVFKRWLFEISSWLISACSMIAIVLIYVRIKDQPMSTSSAFLTWTNVLGKFASAALIVPTTEALGQLKWNWFHNSKAMWDFEIFDKASRGPLGALMLLYRTKGRSLAALGALLILLLLAIDTFFQQVTDIGDRWVLQSTAGELPRTTWYTSKSDSIYREGVEVISINRDMSLAIDQFSYGAGIQSVTFGSSPRPEIPVTCPTSNCTWPAHETLAVCSQCADVSSYLDFACVTRRADWIAQLDGGFENGGGFPNATMCGYFLNATSEDPTLMSGYIYNADNLTKGEALVMRTLPLTTLYTRDLLYGNGSIHFKDLRNTIADFLVVSAANGSAETVYQNVRPVANECVLHWCVQTIRASYDEGAYHEEVVNIAYNTTTGPSPWLATPFETEFENGTDVFYMEDIVIDMDQAGHDNVVYGTSNSSASAIILGFIDIFPSFSTVMNESAVPSMRFKIWSTGPAWIRYLDFNPWLAPNNVTRHMERLAKAMTNVIRSTPGQDKVAGAAYSSETYISVKWAWLTFPLILLVLTFVFLVSTVIKTSKDTGAGIWKTSAMPTLIYSLPKETQAQFAKSSTSNSAHNTKKVRIRLLPKTGWRVSGQSQLVSSPQPPHSAVQAPRGWI